MTPHEVPAGEHTLTIYWRITTEVDGWWVTETLGIFSNRFGPIPDRTTCDALIIERRGMTMKILQGQLTALDVAKRAAGQVVQ